MGGNSIQGQPRRWDLLWLGWGLLTIFGGVKYNCWRGFLSFADSHFPADILETGNISLLAVAIFFRSRTTFVVVVVGCFAHIKIK